MYFESHAHYDDERFDEDRDTLLTKLHGTAGIDFIVNSGANIDSTKAGIALSEKYNFIFAAAGVHPHDVKTLSEERYLELKALAKHPRIVAIGEIGLDFYYDNSPRDIQRHWFRRHLELAAEMDLPVIIHSREAAQECFDIIQESPVRKGVIHCYSGSAQMALDYVKMGFYIGIGGTVTFKGAKKAIEVAKAVPLERILLETDSPYLAPVPKRGERNDSENLFFVAETIAKCRNISHLEVANVTEKNARRLFFKEIVA